MRARKPLSVGGFTLVEMVLVVALTGILAVLLVIALRGPIQAAADTERRARLVDIAQTALGRMTRELRLALPNSIRIASAPNVVSVEMLRTLDGGRYRAAPASGPPPNCDPMPAPPGDDPLEFTCADPTFDPLGPLPRTPQIKEGGDCVGSPTTADCVVVFNTGDIDPSTGLPTETNAYKAAAPRNIATIVPPAPISNGGRITLEAGFTFPFPSPAQRFHVVDTPVSFVCNTASGTINRFEGYPITQAQSLAPGGSSALLVNNVTGCDFDYDPGTATRGGIVTLSLAITEPASGESVTLLQQVHVSNQP